MTAEQALIVEHKKDPRVRYITYHPELKIFHLWTHRPNLDASTVLENGEKGAFYCDENYESLISYHHLDLNSDSFIILCIDDIKQEVPPIPEKWYIECTEENISVLDDWRLKNAKEHLGWILRIGHIVLSKNLNDSSLFHLNYDKCFPSDDYKHYEEITLEQFKKYVLKQEPEEQTVTIKINDKVIKTEKIKKQDKTYTSNDMADSFKYSIANHPIMSISESEREEFGSVELKGRYIKTGRIQVPNSFDDSFESQDKRTQQEVITLYPRRMWDEDRLNAINQSVKSYLDNDYCIPTEWIEERNELIETLNNL